MAYPYIYYWGARRFWDKAEPQLHLLTAGYRGPVLIVFSDSSGAPPRYEGKARRYDIPLSGFLRTQFGPNQGWGRPDYEYVDAAGKRTRIVPGTPGNLSLPGDSVQACSMGRKFIKGRSPEYSAYVVSRRDNRRQLYGARR